MMMSEVPKCLINLLAEISNMNLLMSSQQPSYQNGPHNEVWKCIQAKKLDKNKILKCFNVMFFIM